MGESIARRRWRPTPIQLVAFALVAFFRSGERIVKGVVRPISKERACPIRVEITMKKENVEASSEARVRHRWTEVDRTVRVGTTPGG